MAIGFMKKISPEYVLAKAFTDVKKNGIDGLKPYLTKEATKKVEVIQAVSTGINMFSSLGQFVGASSDKKTESNQAVAILMEKLSECEFDYKDLMKGSENAKAVIAFNYKDAMEGTVDISMIKQDKEWKIDNLGMPHFNKFSLPANDSSANS